MNNTGFFFCGLLVGVVVSAAFGLDFFPSVDLQESSGSGARGSDGLRTSAGHPALLGQPDGHQDLATELGSAKSKVVTLEKNLATAQKALESKEAEVTTLEARLKASTPDRGLELAELKRAQADLEQERLRARRLEADLELSHRETYNLLKEFFTSKRSAEDAILISEYFATSAPEKLKGDLVDQLLRTNRVVIASLSPVSSQFPEAGLAPAGARANAAAPESAVLRDGDRGSRDSQTTSDASDPSTTSIQDESRAVRLPRPPGE